MSGANPLKKILWFFTVVGFLSVISGCDQKKYAIESCKDIVRSLAYKDDAAFFYAEDYFKSSISKQDLEIAYSHASVNGLVNPSLKRYIGLVYDDKNPPVKHWVDMGFQAVGFKNGSNAKVRCVMIGFDGKTFIESVEIDKNIYMGGGLLKLLYEGRPSKELIDLVTP